MFARFDTIHERDRQTDGQTPHDGIGRAMHGVERQKSDVSDHTMQDVEYLLSSTVLAGDVAGNV